MRLGTLVVITIALGSAPHTLLCAQGSNASEILSSSRKAIGNAKLDSLSTLSVDASLQRNMGDVQLTSEVELLLAMPDKYVRTDVSTGMMRGGFTTGFNGDKPLRSNATAISGGGMMIRMGPGPGPATEKPSPEEQARMDAAMLRAARSDLSRLMLGWFAMSHPSVKAEYTLAGEAESPDGKAWVIDAKGADGFEARLFIDQETKLPLMVNYKGPQPRIVTSRGAPGEGRTASPEQRLRDVEREPPTMVDFTLYFEDWQEVDGVKFPHKIRRASAGTTNEEWTVTKVKVNPKIDPKKFSVEG